VNSITAPVDPRIKAVLIYLRQNCAAPLELDSVAAAVGLSTSRLRHLIRLHTGESPSQYLKNLRIQMVRDLLETTPLSVKEIVGRVGYSDASRLFKDFKAQFGLSPRQHRLRHCNSVPAAIIEQIQAYVERNKNH